jgi:hypothetical protein
MPKPSKATAATKATFTEREVHELFNTKHTSHWEEGVEYLCGQYQIDKYIVFLTHSGGEEDKWVTEFSALADYLGRKGQFYLHDCYFIRAIEAIVNGHRRRWAEAIVTQQYWNGLDPTKALCLACIPYANASSLTQISNWSAGSLALAECLRKHSDHHEKKETNTQYYVNRQAKLFSACCRDAQSTAERNNYRRWLSESLIRRIYVGYRGLNEWDVGNEEVRQKTVNEVLQLIEDRGSEIQDEWDNDIKALRRPDLEREALGRPDPENTDADGDNITLVDLW